MVDNSSAVSWSFVSSMIERSNNYSWKTASYYETDGAIYCVRTKYYINKDASFGGVLFANEINARIFMLRLQKDAKNEITAWLTNKGVIVMPYEGYVNGKWQRNQYDKAHSNWFPVANGKVTYEGNSYIILGHIHTHPTDEGFSPEDRNIFRNGPIPAFIFSPNNVYMYQDGVSLDITLEFSSGYSLLFLSNYYKL